MLPDDNEMFWSGSKLTWTESDFVVNRMQSSDGKRWLEDNTGLVLDPTYSEYSVRIYHPGSRTLSFVLGTIAILPKSLLKQIHRLLEVHLYGCKED